MTIFLQVMVLFLAGYMAISIQQRYIWVITFLLLISGTLLMQKSVELIRLAPKYCMIAWVLFFSSFLVFPVNWLKDAAGADKELFMLAKEWKAKGIQGKFASTANGNHQLLQRVAYINDSQYYIPTREANNYRELQTAVQENGIDYFFFFLPVQYRFRCLSANRAV
ncbi:hypothetical protein [Paraflavitalea speifideaquila]|uniref:hypothetical protein n=1 Tax=Paraflavitalea speifideaquila TaxID=3076558 RepID=UPI0028F1102C|nr:hypothetical protein [Paraflavitalea speifideiaquila]